MNAPAVFTARQTAAVMIVGVIGVLIGGAQLVGSSLGPFTAAFLVGDHDVGPILWFGAACAVAGMTALVGGGIDRSAVDIRPA